MLPVTPRPCDRRRMRFTADRSSFGSCSFRVQCSPRSVRVVLSSSPCGSRTQPARLERPMTSPEVERAVLCALGVRPRSGPGGARTLVCGASDCRYTVSATSPNCGPGTKKPGVALHLRHRVPKDPVKTRSSVTSANKEQGYSPPCRRDYPSPLRSGMKLDRNVIIVGALLPFTTNQGSCACLS